MPNSRLTVRKYLYRLDEIEDRVRGIYPDCTFLYLQLIGREFTRHFIHVVTEHSDEINGALIDAFYFFMNERLREIFLNKSDFQWLAYDFAEEGLFPRDHVIGKYSTWVNKH